jgi:alkylation response protein AidB-like acyl-CoA dehydrogenase
VERVVLASGADARRRFDAVRRDWRVLAAASLVGVGAAAVEITADYARQRHQFGRPIGSFQALAHAVVDAATDVDGARLLVQEAAWAVDDGDGRADALAVMALRFAAEASQRATATGLHVHGGYGFMLEYDIQLLYRRARAWPLALGTPDDELQRLADALWGPTTTAPAA